MVTKNISKEFIEKFVKNTEKLRVGDPTLEDTDMGPLVNLSGLNKIDDQVTDAVKNGAEILTGGKRIKDKGYFYSPTILTKISSNMRVSTRKHLVLLRLLL